MKRLLLSLLTIGMLIISVCTFAEEGYDSYIIKYKDGYSPEQKAETSLFSLRTDEEPVVKPVVEEWNMYTVSAENLDRIDMSMVEYIEPNYELELYDYVPNDKYYQEQWNMPLIKMPYVWGQGWFGENVKVAVIDSGIDLYHRDMADCIVVSKCVDFTGSGYIGETTPEYYAISNTENLHGTSVASIIAATMDDLWGMAGMTKAELYMLKVFKAVQVDSTTIETSGRVDHLLEALHYAATRLDCDVLNMSLGFKTNSGEALPSTSQELRILNTALGYARSNGTIVVAASGNTYDNSRNYPACCDHVISVGAVDKYKNRASFSTYNDKVDIVAPGKEVWAARGYYPTVERDRDLWSYVNGTSFAAPHVAAAAAIVKGMDSDINQDKMELLIKYSSDDLGTVGRDDYYGWGMLNMKTLTDFVDDTAAELVAGIPRFDEATKTITLEYFNSDDENVYTASAMAVIYDESGCIDYVNPRVTLSVPAFSELEYTFENIEIPSGGWVKIFCIKDWENMIPATRIVEVKPAL